MIGKMLIQAAFATVLIASAAAVYANWMGNAPLVVIGQSDQAKGGDHDND